MRPFFISGIGTGIGKTVAAAIFTEALRADYWKPVQAGLEPQTDSEWIASVISSPTSRIHPEAYRFSFPASPHISAEREGVRIDVDRILSEHKHMDPNRLLVIEGAGGLMVPLNEKEFVIDLIRALNARLILVSRNYLGSINHSLLSAHICRSHGLDVAGWIFNDQYLDYEKQIAEWSGYPRICSLPQLDILSKQSVHDTAHGLQKAFVDVLNYL